MHPNPVRRASAALVLATLAAAALLPLGTAQAAGVSGQGTWETTLLPRDINNDGMVDAFYDTVLDVSWLANADANGPMNWANANAWAAGLDVYGKTGWRLPTMIDTGAPGCDWSLAGGTDCGYNVQTISADGQTVFSEMAHLWYVSLANKAVCTPGDSICNTPQPGWGLTNTGAFRNLHASYYWSGVALATSRSAWYFDTYRGEQFGLRQGNELAALAVHPGDVGIVPEPQTYALLLMGVAAVLLGVRQRRSRHRPGVTPA
jgi:hypothetical protein